MTLHKFITVHFVTLIIMLREITHADNITTLIYTNVTSLLKDAMNVLKFELIVNVAVRSFTYTA